MPDVYHYDEETGEAITLFGSVPIDDTQASEDTVYSSAKVETMIDEVQDRVNSKTFGTAENLSSYTSVSPKTFESDGYLTVDCTGGNGRFKFNGSIDAVFPSGTRELVYVKKGMTYWNISQSSGVTLKVIYYPLTS